MFLYIMGYMAVGGGVFSALDYRNSAQFLNANPERTQVISGEVQSRPDNFNKDKNLNWWWAGQAALDSMVDIAKASCWGFIRRETWEYRVVSQN